MFNHLAQSPVFKSLLSNLSAALTLVIVSTIGQSFSPSGGAADWAATHPAIAAPLYVFANSVYHNYLTKWGFVVPGTPPPVLPPTTP